MLALGLVRCAAPATPGQECEADAGAACCVNEDCGAEQYCDYDYICSPAPGGEVQCGEPSGDRQCHDTCDASVGCEDPGQDCVAFEQFQGGDAGLMLYRCE